MSRVMKGIGVIKKLSNYATLINNFRVLKDLNYVN